MKNITHYWLTLLLLAGVFVLACKDDSATAPSPKFALSGQVFNTTQRGVRSVSISLLRQGESTPAFNTTTNDTGFYRLPEISGGTYTLRITRDGYTAVEIPNLTISADTRRIDTLQGTANARGRILNSQTGQGVSGASVSFYRDSDTSVARAELRTITNTNGEFVFRNVPFGRFVCVVRANNFITQVINDVVLNPTGTTELPPSTIVQPPPPGGFRIVLTWGAQPPDLDSYLSGPLTGTSRFVCFYGNRTPANSNVELDVDDVNGFGPETITITSFRDGMYRYSVHNFSNQSANGYSGIASSPARVQVYNNSGLIREFTAPTPPPTASGNAWRVFEIDVSGTTRNIRAINTYVTMQVGNDGSTARVVQGDLDKKKSTRENPNF